MDSKEISLFQKVMRSMVASEIESRIDEKFDALTKLIKERNETDLIEEPINLPQAAELTGYSESYLRKMTAAPEQFVDPIPFHKKLGRIHLFRSEVMKWLRDQN